MSKTAFQRQFTSNNTTVTGDIHAGSVQLYQTVIARWDADMLTLNTGGWATVTTKSRMNEVCKALGVPIRVYSLKGKFYAHTLNRESRSFDRGLFVIERPDSPRRAAFELEEERAQQYEAQDWARALRDSGYRADPARD